MTRATRDKEPATRALSMKVSEAFWNELDEFVASRPAMTKSGVLRAGFELFRKQQEEQERKAGKEGQDG